MSEIDDLIERGLLKKGIDLPLPEIPDAPDIDLGGLPVSERPFFDADGNYRPGNGKGWFPKVAHDPEPQHVAFYEFRERMTKKPREGFYVESKHGTIGWVPWIGSPVVWPWEAAWECDLLEGSESDFVKEKMK